MPMKTIEQRHLRMKYAQTKLVQQQPLVEIKLYVFAVLKQHIGFDLVSLCNQSKSKLLCFTDQSYEKSRKEC